MWQKRPIDVGTPEVRAMEGVDERGALRYVYEVCGSVKRDLLSGKRDLLILAYLRSARWRV